MIEQQIEELVLRKLEEPDFQDCFLIELTVSPKKKIEIIIDADEGVTFEKCQKISRYVEAWLDTEGPLGNDYTLEVSSPGVSRPLKYPRQYPKNVGRTLEIVDTEGDKTVGVLQSADAEKIVLTFEEVRKEGKKKIKETILKEFQYPNVKKATVKIVF